RNATSLLTWRCRTYSSLAASQLPRAVTSRNRSVAGSARSVASRAPAGTGAAAALPRSSAFAPCLPCQRWYCQTPAAVHTTTASRQAAASRRYRPWLRVRSSDGRSDTPVDPTRAGAPAWCRAGGSATMPPGGAARRRRRGGRDVRGEIGVGGGTLIGCDGGRLPEGAVERMKEAALVAGGVRHLAHPDIPPGVETALMGEGSPTLDRIADVRGEVVVLAGGDPGFFGALRGMRSRGLRP